MKAYHILCGDINAKIDTYVDFCKGRKMDDETMAILLIQTLDSINKKYFGGEEEFGFSVLYKVEKGKVSLKLRNKFAVLNEEEGVHMKESLIFLIMMCKAMKSRQIEKACSNDEHAFGLRIRQVGDKVTKDVTEYYVDLMRIEKLTRGQEHIWQQQ